MSLKIKSVPQLIDLVSNETVNFKKTPQINGVDISTGGTPAGSTTQIQYNDDSVFAGSSNLTFNGTTLTGSFTGSLAEFTTLSASNISLAGTALQPIKYYQKPMDPIGKIWAPEVYYKFDSDFSDSSDFGRTATTAGTVAPTINTSTKKFGAGSLLVAPDGALTFDTQDQIQMIGDTTGWSISFWIQKDAVPTAASWPTIITRAPSYGGWATGTYSIGISGGSYGDAVAGDLMWNRYGSTIVRLLDNSSYPIINATPTWYHIAMVFRRYPGTGTATTQTFARVWYNGTETTSLNSPITCTHGPVKEGAIFIYGEASGGGSFYLDDYIFFNYPLSPAIITELYNSGTGQTADVAGIMT